MTRRTIARFAALLCLAAFTPVAAAAAADAYPTKPIRVIVVYGPGGTADILARVTAQKLSESLGQQVIVENRPGAGGIIGTGIAAKSAPDGYTLYQAAIGPLTISPWTFGKVPYDPINDFEPIILAGTLPLVLTVHPSVPATSVHELIALAKSRPGQLNFGSSGNGTSTHLSGELFKTMAGVDIVHVPYNGTSASTAAALGGQVQITFGDSSVLALVKAGKLRALAVTSGKRSAIAPELPTMAEAGLPGYESYAWLGLMAPKGTSKDIVRKLNVEMSKVLHMPDVREKLLNRGIEPVTTTPEEFGRYVGAELAKWEKIVKTANVRTE